MLWYGLADVTSGRKMGPDEEWVSDSIAYTYIFFLDCFPGRIVSCRLIPEVRMACAAPPKLGQTIVEQIHGWSQDS